MFMSFTNTVPPGVPSLFHSSTPVAPSFAEKYSSLPRTASLRGRELAPSLMSFTRTVPACVPSLFHSSTPVTPSSAEKNQVPLTKANSVGRGVPLAPGKEFPVGLMSFTRTVPVSVPSVFHSSMPLIPSSAANSMMLEVAGAEPALLAPPPQPANADTSARALVTLHNGPIKLSSRWIMAPTFHPRDRSRPSLHLRPPFEEILPARASIPGSDRPRSH